MTKLLTQDAAIKYLREMCGCMSPRIFQDEVHAGRIPQKPFGNAYRKNRSVKNPYDTDRKI